MQKCVLECYGVTRKEHFLKAEEMSAAEKIVDVLMMAVRDMPATLRRAPVILSGHVCTLMLDELAAMPGREMTSEIWIDMHLKNRPMTLSCKKEPGPH